MKLNKLLIPLLGTMLGSAFVFMMKDEMSARLQITFYSSLGQRKAEMYIMPASIKADPNPK